MPLYEVYNNIGVFLIKKKQYTDAVNHLKPAVDAAPRDTDTLFNLGYAYYLAKDYANAVQTLKAEIERRASDGEAHYVLSKSLAALNDQAGSTQAADQAKKLLTSFAQWETKGVPVLARIKTTFSKANYYRYKREIDERLNTQAKARASRRRQSRSWNRLAEPFSRDETKKRWFNWENSCRPLLKTTRLTY